MNEFSPRVGISWDPYGTGKTVIHGYGGMFYMPMQFGFGLVSNNPAYQSYNVNVFQVPLAYPQENPPLPPGTQNVTIFPAASAGSGVDELAGRHSAGDRAEHSAERELYGK